MSSVTNVILLTMCGELRDEYNPTPILTNLNNWLAENHYGALDNGPLVVVNHLGGGFKCITSDIAIGAFNYFDVEEFVQQVLSQDWQSPKCVQLMIKDENDELWSFVLAGGGLPKPDHLPTCHSEKYKGCDPKCRRGAEYVEAATDE
jgi:hypothetical protein